MPASSGQSNSSEVDGRLNCGCNNSSRETSPQSTTSPSGSNATPAVQQSAKCNCDPCDCSLPRQSDLERVNEAPQVVRTSVSSPAQTGLTGESVVSSSFSDDNLNTETELDHDSRPRSDSTLDDGEPGTPVESGTSIEPDTPAEWEYTGYKLDTTPEEERIMRMKDREPRYMPRIDIRLFARPAKSE